LKNQPPPMTPTILSEPTAAYDPPLQALVVTCDGVEYMFFGPPLLITDQGTGIPNVESLAFAGLFPTSEMIKVLQRAKDKDFFKAPNVQ